MDIHGRLATFVTALVVSANIAPSSAVARDSAFAAACSRNPTLRAYTFHVDVAMRMQTFPWLHFHLDGTGSYVRGQRYAIQLDRMPFFARSFKTIDLSALDPSMWPRHFAVQVEGRRNGTTTFLLRSLKTDPRDDNPLVAADVRLDSEESTREVTLHYASGEIHMMLNPGETQGFRLPASTDVDIRMPGRNLSAHADFNHYTIEEPLAFSNR